MTSDAERFDWRDPAHAAAWLADRTSGNPQRAEQLEIVLTLLAALQPDGHRVLDLGCGDALPAALVLDRFPAAHVTGLDSSPPMLAAARARLAALPSAAGRWTLVAAAMQDLPALGLPAGGFDAAVAVQTVHHLTVAEKQTLFRAVAGLLRPGGLFVLSDRVSLTPAALFPYYRALWNRLPAPPDPVRHPPEADYPAHLARLAAGGDRPDPVEDQVAWLTAAGFAAAGCFYRYAERAVFGGVTSDT